MIDRSLETPRLLIRRFQPDDWRDLFVYTGDPVVMTWIPEGVMTEMQAREFAIHNAGEEAENYAVILKANNRLIGHIVFHPWFAHRTCEIGWVFNSHYQGLGYATEAALAVAQHAFAVLRIHRLIATCQPENTPSYRVMEKLGMRREAHFRRCIYRSENSWWDEYFYAILDEEWRRNSKPLMEVV